MSKAVLISIRPKWCELIASGQKTVEVRKTKPSALLPLKCYIYCTNGGDTLYAVNGKVQPRNSLEINLKEDSIVSELNGYVIGEFVCDSIYPLSFYASDASFFDTEPPLPVPGTCLTDKEIAEYLGNGKTGYGWHISDLVIYDEPKELGEFYRWWNDGDDIRPCQNGKRCQHIVYDYSEDCQACAIDFDGTDCPYLKVTHPPQSWCYVEELT